MSVLSSDKTTTTTLAVGPALLPVEQHQGKPPIRLTRPVYVIGSRSNARIHLLSSSVSKAHALIVRSGGRTYIRDLASRTKVFINGRETREADLDDGDLIKIGSFTFRYIGGPDEDRPTVTPTPVNAKLEVLGADYPVPIEQRVMLIGRRSISDVALVEASVSTAHAVIFEMDGDRYLRDLGSRTGTFVNGVSTHQHKLAPGDSVRIGETEMRYLLNEVAEATVMPEELLPQEQEAAPAEMPSFQQGVTTDASSVPHASEPPAWSVSSASAAAAAAAAAGEDLLAVEPEDVGADEPIQTTAAPTGQSLDDTVAVDAADVTEVPVEPIVAETEVAAEAPSFSQPVPLETEPEAETQAPAAQAELPPLEAPDELPQAEALEALPVQPHRIEIPLIADEVSIPLAPEPAAEHPSAPPEEAETDGAADTVEQGDLLPVEPEPVAEEVEILQTTTAPAEELDITPSLAERKSEPVLAGEAETIPLEPKESAAGAAEQITTEEVPVEPVAAAPPQSHESINVASLLAPQGQSGPAPMLEPVDSRENIGSERPVEPSIIEALAHTSDEIEVQPISATDVSETTPESNETAVVSEIPSVDVPAEAQLPQSEQPKPEVTADDLAAALAPAAANDESEELAPALPEPEMSAPPVEETPAGDVSAPRPSVREVQELHVQQDFQQPLEELEMSVPQLDFEPQAIGSAGGSATMEPPPLDLLAPPAIAAEELQPLPEPIVEAPLAAVGPQGREIESTEAELESLQLAPETAPIQALPPLDEPTLNLFAPPEDEAAPQQTVAEEVRPMEAPVLPILPLLPSDAWEAAVSGTPLPSLELTPTKEFKPQVVPPPRKEEELALAPIASLPPIQELPPVEPEPEPDALSSFAESQAPSQTEPPPLVEDQVEVIEPTEPTPESALKPAEEQLPQLPTSEVVSAISGPESFSPPITPTVDDLTDTTFARDVREFTGDEIGEIVVEQPAASQPESASEAPALHVPEGLVPEPLVHQESIQVEPAPEPEMLPAAEIPPTHTYSKPAGFQIPELMFPQATRTQIPTEAFVDEAAPRIEPVPLDEAHRVAAASAEPVPVTPAAAAPASEILKVPPPPPPSSPRAAAGTPAVAPVPPTPLPFAQPLISWGANQENFLGGVPLNLQTIAETSARPAPTEQEKTSVKPVPPPAPPVSAPQQKPQPALSPVQAPPPPRPSAAAAQTPPSPATGPVPVLPPPPPPPPQAKPRKQRQVPPKFPLSDTVIGEKAVHDLINEFDSAAAAADSAVNAPAPPLPPLTAPQTDQFSSIFGVIPPRPRRGSTTSSGGGATSGITGFGDITSEPPPKGVISTGFDGLAISPLRDMDTFSQLSSEESDLEDDEEMADDKSDNEAIEPQSRGGSAASPAKGPAETKQPPRPLRHEAKSSLPVPPVPPAPPTTMRQPPPQAPADSVAELPPPLPPVPPTPPAADLGMDDSGVGQSLWGAGDSSAHQGGATAVEPIEQEHSEFDFEADDAAAAEAATARSVRARYVRRVSVLVCAMVVVIALTAWGIYNYVGVPSTVEGRFTYKNLATWPKRDQQNFQADQLRALKEDITRKNAALLRRPEVPPGFLDNGHDYVELMDRSASFSESRPDVLDIQIKGTDGKGDQARLAAILLAMYEHNQQKIADAARYRGNLESLKSGMDKDQNELKRINSEIERLRLLEETRPTVDEINRRQGGIL